MLKTLIKDIVRKAFRMLGLTVQRGGMRATMEDALRHIRRQGVMPATVIDVGVAYGTKELYEVYPEPRYMLIEPLEEYRPTLEGICRRVKGDFMIAAVSDHAGTASFNVHDILSGSSLLKESDGAIADGKAREVPTVTLDGVVKEKGLTGPFLIKLDTQGADLLVLAGASETLKQTEAVLVEAFLFQFFVGGPQLHDLVLFMKDRGFLACDIFGGARRPIDGALAHVDIVFARDGSILRRTHHFATPEQRMKINRPAGSGDPLLR
ncbi:MAG: FkbM family methyltransferase [Candidatus Coatesbacteria bacterium]